MPHRLLNFGDLESGVNIFKHHLKKQIETPEEFLTVQVEGTLNIRPLRHFSSDPSYYETLTPGQLLLGHSINNIREPSLINLPDNFVNFICVSVITSLIFDYNCLATYSTTEY